MDKKLVNCIALAWFTNEWSWVEFFVSFIIAH